MTRSSAPSSCLLNAGHEATVNTLGNGLRGLLTHPAQWREIVDGEVSATTAVEEMIRWDGPLQLFERWVLDDGVRDRRSRASGG